MISFVRSGRERSPLWTATRGSEPGQVFARSDRSRGLRAIGTDERTLEGRGQQLAPAQRLGAVRTDEHQSRGDGGAVARHEQLWSGLANKAKQTALASHPFNEHMHRVMEPVVSLPAGSTVLDAGCGQGGVARWLAEQAGHHVLGIDLELNDDAATNDLRTLPEGGTLDLRRGDFLALTSPQPYESVLLLGVLHYAGSADGVRRMLRATDALAAPGAPLAVSWICDEVPLTYEEVYLPSRDLVTGTLADLGWSARDAWERDVTHAHGGSPLHDHRVVYGVWRRT